MPLAVRASKGDTSSLYAPRKTLTIIREPIPVPDAAALALRALGWVLSDDARAGRFLALTGLTPDALRGGLHDGAVLGAVIDFLSHHEADLVAAAQALDIGPDQLISAKEALR